MGYFSNNSDQQYFEKEHCRTCIHSYDDDEKFCPVMNAHFLYQHDRDDDLLSEFIPKDNSKCEMYVNAPNQTPWDE